MKSRFAFSVLPAVIVMTAFAKEASAQGAIRKITDPIPAGCPVTKPPVPRFIPPGTERVPLIGGYFFGTPNLWVWVLHNPVSMFGEKVVWGSQGYDAKADRRPALTITLRRLDPPGPAVAIDGNAAGSSSEHWESFIMTGVKFPDTGCYEITGRFQGEELRIVYWVW